MQISRFISVIFGLAVLAAAVFVGVSYFSDTTPPLVSVRLEGTAVNRDHDIVIDLADEGSGLRSVVVTADQDQAHVVLLDKKLDGAKKAEVKVHLGDTSFKEGPFTLHIEAADASAFHFGAGAKQTVDQQLTLDTRKPVIDLQSQFHNLTRGGSGLAVYTADENLSRTGVKVGDFLFPGYRLADGRYACLFAFPWFMSVNDFSPVLVAVDMAGNERDRPLPFHANDKQFRNDNINISDRFLDDKMQQFESDFPDLKSNLEIFLKVNRDLRKKDMAHLLELGATSMPEVMWKEAFLRPEGQTMSQFADHRTYIYHGQKIDEQVHTGMDIANVANTPVQATNPGKIVMAQFFDIYGNAVVIDHGLGLMSLYGHLSQINVHVGDMVTRGQVIGHSGATGMAGGDHLHYEMFVSGQSVNPTEWWDPHWVKDNFFSKLGGK
ncbi:Peptidase M23 [Desulfovibrio sp. X2]|uniref:M23 family metallopeptidase n=1 Tax=Desulfovibrio sp. X2 TaxID=941449 RepID=UPI000358D2E2|nr:M23 family metallopeptidase [Desulfovibrio sp. X2]EPR42213.1 Peptidase M23 [Desulfovibrio sp. X2]